MKRLIPTAMAFALLGGTSAVAAPQDDHRDRGERGDRGDRGQAQAPGWDRPQRQAPQAAPQAQPQARPQAAPQQAAPQQAQPQAAQPQRGQRFQGAHPPAQVQQPAQAQQAPQARQAPGWDRPRDQRFDDRNRPQSFDRDRGDRGRAPGWDQRRGERPQIRPEDRRDRDYNRRRYDPRQWQFRIQPQHRYQWRGSYYRLPYGYYSHNWLFGEILPWSWYTPDYYINDWGFYGLPYPPIGAEWVRSGNDAILVDIYTGQVLSVEYGLFF